MLTKPNLKKVDEFNKSVEEAEVVVVKNNTAS